MINWTIVAIFVNVVVVSCTAVWAVSKVSAATGVLSETIRNLAANVLRLEKTIDDLENRIFDHEKRLITIEAKESK